MIGIDNKEDSIVAKILISPSKYVQGPKELKKLGSYTQGYGKKALILISDGGYKRIGKMIEDSFAKSTCEYHFDFFQYHERNKM